MKTQTLLTLTISLTLLATTISTANATNQIPPKNSHEYLMKHTPNYKKNYEKAGDFVIAGAISTCAKIAGDDKLNSNDSKVYLITTYHSFINSDWTTKDKMNFIVLYYHEASWANAPTDKINAKFQSLMEEAKTFLRDKDASKLEMPMIEEEEVSIDEL